MGAISPRAWAILLATYFAYVSVYCARKPFSVVKSVIEKELSISQQNLANIDTALLTTYAIGQLSLGPLVKIVGRKLTLILAFALSGAATAAFGVCDSPLPMILAWGAAGLFAAPASPLFSIVVGESVPDSVRGTVIGIWSSCENLGGAFANLVAARVLAVQGWRAAFFVSGPIVGIWALILAIVLPSDPTAPPAPKATASAAASGPAPSALSIPGVGAVSACYTLTKCSRYCLMFWLPYFLSTYVQLSPASAGSIAALLDAAGALGAILTGIACDTLYGGATLRAAMHLCFATGVSFGAWAFACANGATANVHIAAILAVGFFVAGPGGVLGSSARGLVGFAGRAKEGALIAAVAGLVNGTGSVGAVLQGLFASQLVSLCGWPGLFAILAAAMLSASLLLLPAVAVETAGLQAKLKAA